MTILQGCDTSNNNHGRRSRFDFHAAATDGAIGFVYLKCDEGVNFKDGNYVQDSNDAAGQGLHTGAYHFARPEWNAALDEARFFNANKLNPGSTWLDLESGLPQLGPTQLATWASIFIQNTNVTGIYWNKSYRDALLPHFPNFDRLQWVAAPSDDVWPTGAWVWQYGQGAVPGIGPVDLNRSIVLA